MHAAILCPGPSLLAVLNRLGERHLYIGVNRAPFIVRGSARVDWWAFDPRAYPGHDPGYPVRLYAGKHAEAWLAKRGARIVLDEYHERLVERWPTTTAPWTDFTVTAALVLAADRGSQRIDVFGCDRSNRPDADGVSLKTNDRSARRWKKEAATWDATVALLARRKVAVERVT